MRGRDDLVATRVQLANQLRSLLESFWPGAAEVTADVNSPIALAFIDRHLTPETAGRLGPKRMAAFCAQHASSGRRPTTRATPTPIRILAKAWVRVIWHVWTNRKTYDPTQRRAAQTLLRTVGG